MMRPFFVVGIIISSLALPLAIFAGPREMFLRGELKFLDFQNPAPEYMLSVDTRARLKEHFLSTYNKTLASLIRLEHEAGRIERALSARELTEDSEQLRTKLAYSRTRIAEAQDALDSIKIEFEKILVADIRTTLRTRASRIIMRFEKEVATPMRAAHTTLIGIVLKLKETQ
ncbi:MAG: hypothetical protein AAB367_00105 [Patescibacteria group bacterium]